MDRIAQVMTRSLPGVSPSASIAQAAELAAAWAVDHLLVLEGDDLVGIISVEDLRRFDAAETVYAGMSAPVRTISANSSVQEAADLMRRCDVDCLPVVAGGLLLGVVTRNALRGERAEAAAP